MPTFRVSYRASATVRVLGTIEADTEADARALVAAGEPLDDEESDVQDMDGPSGMNFDCEMVEESPQTDLGIRSPGQGASACVEIDAADARKVAEDNAAPDLLAASKAALGFVSAWAAHLNDTGKSVASYNAGKAAADLRAAIARATN